MSNELREAARQALEALKTYVSTYNDYWERGMEILQPMGEDALGEVIGCFEAALAEGLLEALSETKDERLKDLVERRLMYALYAAQNAAPQPASRAIFQEDALKNLVNQIRKTSPVDDHGHKLTMNMAYLEACKLLDASAEQQADPADPNKAIEHDYPQPPAEPGAELSDAAARAGGDYWKDTPSNIRNEIIAAVIAADRAARRGAK